MKTAKPGRPKNPPGGERFTLVLDEAGAEQVRKLRARFTERWGATPTLSVLVTRGLMLAEDEIVNTPPEYDPLRTSQGHLRRVKADVERALSNSRQEVLFTLYGDITQLIQNAVQLRGAIKGRRREWRDNAGALAACEQVIEELTIELGRVGDALRRLRHR
ncbi:MAG: hypothetical protein HS111_10220 [Kofleriaceae bacterium]|nr:hypothetical protein [Kofleriaceae bacterium]